MPIDINGSNSTSTKKEKGTKRSKAKNNSQEQESSKTDNSTVKVQKDDVVESSKVSATEDNKGKGNDSKPKKYKRKSETAEDTPQ